MNIEEVLLDVDNSYKAHYQELVTKGGQDYRRLLNEYCDDVEALIKTHEITQEEGTKMYEQASREIVLVAAYLVRLYSLSKQKKYGAIEELDKILDDHFEGIDKLCPIHQFIRIYRKGYESNMMKRLILQNYKTKGGKGAEALVCAMLFDLIDSLEDNSSIDLYKEIVVTILPYEDYTEMFFSMVKAFE